MKHVLIHTHTGSFTLTMPEDAHYAAIARIALELLTLAWPKVGLIYSEDYWDPESITKALTEIYYRPRARKAR